MYLKLLIQLLIRFFENNNEYYNSNFQLNKNFCLDSMKFDIGINELKGLKEVYKSISNREKNKNENNNSKKNKNTDIISTDDILEINQTLEEINKLKVLIYHEKKLKENKTFERDLDECLENIHYEIEQISSTENITENHIENLRKRIKQINN